MRGPSTTKAFQRGFLKSLVLSLQSCNSADVATNLEERKRAIKSSADVAMAVARGGGARWPRAILSSSSRPAACNSPAAANKARRCKRIVRRCCGGHYRRRRDGVAAGASLARATTTAVASSSSREVARRLVRKRTKVLRKMIPGGELLLDEISLLREAMDYVAHLHAQVDVLRRISKAVK